MKLLEHKDLVKIKLLAETKVSVKTEDLAEIVNQVMIVDVGVEVLKEEEAVIIAMVVTITVIAEEK